MNHDIRRITKEQYEKKRDEFKSQQKILKDKIDNASIIDEAYQINANYVLNVCSRAPELFESSEPEQKRLLINMALQNLRLDDEKVHYEWIKPFDTIAESVHSTDETVQNWSPEIKN